MNDILKLVGMRTRVSIRSVVRPDSTTLIDSIAGVALLPARISSCGMANVIASVI